MDVPKVAVTWAMIALGLNVVIWLSAFFSSTRGQDTGKLLVFTVVAFIQLIASAVAVISGIRRKRRRPAIIGGLAFFGAIIGWFFGIISTLIGVGSSWGRPLRVRGRVLTPGLREGSDWTRGAQPNTQGLDAPTRLALEALWLADAQTEHASVPAFTRVSWLLAAAGAPAELLIWCHKAALEEIEHTRLCFALAAGYGGRSHTVEPMPELLVGGLGLEGHPLCLLASESLSDGCHLEDFNADIAAECARLCRDDVTRGVLERIALEERSHAELSWAVLEWTLERDRPRVQPAIEQTLARLSTTSRPTAVGWDKRSLVEAADAEHLRAHGRLPDASWADLWSRRLEATHRRLQAVLAVPGSARSLKLTLERRG